MNNYSNDLIFGKNKQEGIVSIEATDSGVEIFYQSPPGTGTINSKMEDNVYWLLTNTKVDNTYIKLDGNLHYQYAKTFRDRTSQYKTRAYLKSRGIDTYSVADAKEAIMLRNGYTYFKGMSVKDVSILSFDIETTGLKHDEDSKILLISCTVRTLNKPLFKTLFCYDKYDNQGEMLKDFCLFVTQENPSIIVGHNILSFDLPYMKYIADKENIKLLLGRDGSELHFNAWDSKFRKDGSQSYTYHKIHCYGREVIDTLFLSIKYDATERKFESYGLKNIIKQLGMEKKDRVFYDASTIRHKYKIPEEWEKIKAYCADDSDDSLQLFDLMSPPFFYSAQSIPKSFQAIIESATGSQINAMMTRAYLQNKHSIPKANEASHYEGGGVTGNPGLYKNVWKVDVASLYPSIMIQYEVEDKAKDPNGYFKELVKTFTAERLKNKQLFKDTKNEYYDGLQASQKILINSMYGFLGTSGLSFNSPEKAAFITKMGREILQQAIDWSKEMGFELVNADTDSISITLSGRHLEKSARQDMLNNINTLFPEKIKFEDDGYFEIVIVLKSKNYVLKKKGEKPKYKGSAILASLKEPRLKQFIKDIIKEIGIERNNYIEVYSGYVREIMNITDINEWCTRKTITDKVLTGERSNETKVNDIIKGTDYKEADKIYTFFLPDKTLCLRENFKGEYCKDTLLKKLYATAKIFDTVIDVKSTFLDYSLKRNKKALEEVLNGKL